ncbi:hypothetical protein FACS1894145_4000 [Bacteroidia bacterium]|nr:hypothetical protein FACS1894145_4000 [Bacteroidia bacterium]
MITKYRFYATMRAVVFSLCLVCSSTTLWAQTVRSDYFLNNSQTRSSMNPAFRPNQGYLGVPFLSDIGVSTYTNSLNLDHLVFERNGERVTFLHPAVSTSDFLSNLSDKNYLDVNAHYKFFTLGWYNKSKGFWTVELGARTVADINIPRSVFDLMKGGFSENENEAIDYSILNLRASATVYAEAAVGYSKSLLEDQLQLGAKVKILLGIGNMELNVERLDISTLNGEWVARSKATLAGAMKGIRPEYNGNSQFKTVEVDGAGLSGYGAGLDIGGAYKFLDNRAHVSLALTDLGFISWSKNNSMHLTAPETEVRIKPEGLGSLEGENDLTGQFDVFKNDLREVINFKDSGKGGRSTALRTNVNVGLAYEVWKNNLSLGVLSSTYMGYHTVSEFTVSANYNPVDIQWLSTALSYSAVHGKFNTVGFALHLAPSKGVCLFIGSDFILPHVNKDYIPTSGKAANFQFGLVIPLGKRVN